MILSLCTLAMVGTAAAQNSLFSFARNKMMENHDVSLNLWDDEFCNKEELKKLASNKQPGEEFDCIPKEEGYLPWHCKADGKGGYEYCVGGNKHLALFSPQPVALVSGDLVTARSKGAVVDASSEGDIGGYYSPIRNGVLEGNSAWAPRNGKSEWYQYSFKTPVSIVEVQTRPYSKWTFTKTYKLSCKNNEGVWVDVEGGKIF